MKKHKGNSQRARVSVLIKAKSKKDDEFYTLATDVHKVLQQYGHLLRNSRIYCPCDTENSAFVATFVRYYKKGILSHMPTFTSLQSGVPFNSLAGRRLMVSSDVIVTNPPFSKLNEFLASLIALNKDFLIIVPVTALANRIIIQRIADGKWRVSPFYVTHFKRPDTSLASVHCVWISSLQIEDAGLQYPHHVHSTEEATVLLDPLCIDIIHLRRRIGRFAHISRVCDIYAGAPYPLAVPCTYLLAHNPLQFKILGNSSLTIEGVRVYKRVFIIAVSHYTPQKIQPTLI